MFQLNNPKVATTFLYIYAENDERSLSRQVYVINCLLLNNTRHCLLQIRIEGTVVELNRSICEKYFRNQPISSQIRDVICNQNQEIDWNDLKKKHDELLQKIEREEIQLEMPENQ